MRKCITTPLPPFVRLSSRRSLRGIVCVVILCLLAVVPGCKEKHKALVTTHRAVGQALISTVDQVRLYRSQGIISEETYQSIKVNWRRAQESYVKASGILGTIIDSDAADISGYTELITQVSIIAADIAAWIEEDRK